MKLMTIHELSEMLQVKTKTLYQWAELGQMPSVKLNGVLRFDLEDIKEWIECSKKIPSSGYNKMVQARGPRKGGMN